MKVVGAIFSTLVLALLLAGVVLFATGQLRRGPPPEVSTDAPGLPHISAPGHDPFARLPAQGRGTAQPTTPHTLRPLARPGTLPQAMQPASPPPPLTGPIERIEIEKSKRRLTVWQGGRVVREWRMALGFAPSGHKVQVGDGRTPEGRYLINRRNDRSKYHLSLGLDYPQPAQRAAAAKAGLDPGGDIFIHGQPNQVAEGFRVKSDWTAGCVAIDNDQIEELFAVAAIGTPVIIRP